METSTKINIEIYTEMTPNPETMKFVFNKMLLPNRSVDFPDEEAAKGSPLASALFGFPFVKGVFIANNFVTITRQSGTEWEAIIPSLKDFLKQYAAEEKEIINKDFEFTALEEETDEKDTETVSKIKKVLEEYVRPAVEMDGGAIEFKSFKQGIVTLILQGACSGCPSSTVTLKAGIEGMLQKMVPQVKEVVAEEG